MGKKYVPIVRAKKTYKLFINDILGCYQLIKKRTPAIPKYQEDQP